MSTPPTHVAAVRPPTPWWQQGGAEVCLALLCAWTWLAPFGPQPALFHIVCYTLLMELLTVGPALLAVGMRPAGSRGGIVLSLLLAVIPAMALWMFHVGTQQGVLSATLAMALMLWRMLALGVLHPPEDRRAFVLTGLLGLLVLLSLVIGTYARELPDFGQTWPTGRALGLATDDPDQWVGSPPRVLATGLVYYGLVLTLRVLASRWPGAVQR